MRRETEYSGLNLPETIENQADMPRKGDFHAGLGGEIRRLFALSERWISRLAEEHWGRLAELILNNHNNLE
jgi:hypothetical protein